MTASANTSAASSTATSTSVRIVARIRPVLGTEIEEDAVVSVDGNAVVMPNPKNEKETFTFPFHVVYGMESDQATIFAEVSPTLKHLFKGNDVTIFAYGVTGSGKTHTMKGNKSPVAERGIIPRLLTAIYRRSKEIEKRSEGGTIATATMSYYEIYNDKVFDLFEAPEKRTTAGLPLREQNGKTHVVGLMEKEISTLKEFEDLYDRANHNRSTSATKLNAHSSRSHAIIRVRVELKDGESGKSKVGTVSCIDLAGSEDNRRTANDKERMIESASINKSLFTLSQCVEAMTKKQSRIPYRESKMTRILSLGQNNGMTVMFLNLAPTKKFHQDTLSALNFANRAKTIEIKNTEPVPPPAQLAPRQQLSGISGVPVRTFGTVKTNTTTNRSLGLNADKKAINDLQRLNTKSSRQPPSAIQNGAKKFSCPSDHERNKRRDRESLNDLVEKKVKEVLAAQALIEVNKPAKDDVSQRLELLEKKLENKGLGYIVLAKQHVADEEDVAALRMYQLARDYFPENQKLQRKIMNLKEKIRNDAETSTTAIATTSFDGFSQAFAAPQTQAQVSKPVTKKPFAVFMDEEPTPQRPAKRARSLSVGGLNVKEPGIAGSGLEVGEQSPRTRQLLYIINSEDVDRIMKLKGVGKKRAEALAQHVRELKESRNLQDEKDGEGECLVAAIKDLEDLSNIKGIGSSMVEKMRGGIELNL